MKTWPVASIVALALTTVVHPQSQRARVFDNARVIVGDGRTIDNAAFVVRGDTVTAVGPKNLLRVLPEGAVHIDLAGKTVMPGIIDAHTHTGYRRRLTFSADNYTRDNILDTLHRLAYHGVVATLEMGTGRGDLPYELRTESHAGAALFHTAGRGFAMPNAGPGVPMRDAAYGVTTEAEARKYVQDLAAKHVDIVKVWVDDRNHTVPKLTPSLYRAIIREAHRNKLRVVAHIFELDDAKDLLRAGIDGFAHLPRDRVADTELIGLARQNPNFFFMLTLWAERRGIFGLTPAWLNEPLLRDTFSSDEVKQLADSFANTSSEELERARALVELEKATLAKLKADRARIVVGTDSGGVSGAQYFGWAAQIEMESMVALGLTPSEAIVAATKNAAAAAGFDRLGMIAAGKSADFIVLDANPLDDIRNTRRISQVFLRGEAVDRAALKSRWSAN